MTSFPSADVYIGDEPYDVHEDTKCLVHVPCRTPLFGDGARIDHVCPPDDGSDDDDV